jgi:hypothetical protein
VGLLNVGWLLALFRVGRNASNLKSPLSTTIPAIVLGSLLLWVIVMFGPGATVVHQGSYATFLLLLATLAAWISTVDGWFRYLILVAQGFLFAYEWLITSPANGFGPPNPFLIVSAIVSFAALFCVAMSQPQSATAARPSELPA